MVGMSKDTDKLGNLLADVDSTVVVRHMMLTQLREVLFWSTPAHFRGRREDWHLGVQL